MPASVLGIGVIDVVIDAYLKRTSLESPAVYWF